MRISPSIVPREHDHDVYLVLDDFGRMGQAWRETDPERADRETIIADLLDGQYSNPVRIVCFNTAEGWARDVSEDIADAIRRRCHWEVREPPEGIVAFLDRFEDVHRPQLKLRLA